MLHKCLIMEYENMMIVPCYSVNIFRECPLADLAIH